MTFEELMAIENEAERVNATYSLFQENFRLNTTKASQVEFLTTVRYMETYLKPGARILDIGAGAGEYSIYLAKKGYQVDSLELSDANIKDFREKIEPEWNINLRQGNALDLSAYESESFDMVLVMGPLYHLQSDSDKRAVIEGAKRVCKQEGILFFTFISHDMVFLTELMYDQNYFASGDYNKETMRLDDFPFVFATVAESKKLIEDSGIQILKEIAQDGVSELLADKINQMDDENYKQYLKYHEMICEKPDMLGMSNHLLYIGKK